MVSNRIRRSSIGASVAAFIIGVVLSATSWAVGGVVHSVHVGGPDLDLFPPGSDANLSITAHMFRDGQVNGRWTDVFGPPPGALPVILAVDCLHVVDNEAWIGGVVVGPAPSFFVGVRALTRIVDNGVSANDFPDMVSFIEEEAFWGVPCTEEPPLDVFPYTKGQVQVR